MAEKNPSSKQVGLLKNGALSKIGGSFLCTELHKAVFTYLVGLTLYRGLCPNASNDPKN